jgi:hypothetical protein
MMGFLEPDDYAIWLQAKHWLNVRSNDEHTLISYRLARALLRRHPEAGDRIVLPAILLHDVGWKMFPEEKLALAVGPNAKYPELQRAHEVEGARIARDILDALTIPIIETGRVIEIIDGHDTRKHALSLEDALMKDADKLWRFTDHGVDKRDNSNARGFRLAIHADRHRKNRGRNPARRAIGQGVAAPTDATA